MILLTGASGFIGKHLLNSLVKEYGKEQILALTSRPVKECPYVLHNDYNFDKRIFEINGYAGLIDTIIHAGAFTPKDASQANDWGNCNQNIYNTDKLINSFLPNLKKIIYLSTLDVYGVTDIITEESIISPSSLYGDSKLYSEKLIACWAESKNILYHILRIGHVYGPGEEAYKKIIPVSMRKLLREEPVELVGDGSDLRAFIYIEDIVDAILNSLHLMKQVGPVNLVSSKSISIKNIIHEIIRISGKGSEIIFLPKNSVSRSLIFDNSKMRKYLLPNEISLLKGLKNEWTHMLNLYK